MCTQAMQQKIADYFKTQPVLKVWLFGSYVLVHGYYTTSPLFIWETYTKDLPALAKELQVHKGGCAGSRPANA